MDIKAGGKAGARYWWEGVKKGEGAWSEGEGAGGQPISQTSSAGPPPPPPPPPQQLTARCDFG
jgi:hypothetical protein